MARPRSDIRPRLVEAARARFLAHGVDGASLREIARDAATHIGMVVYYFPTKDDLFLAVVEEPYAAVTADLEAILQRKGTTRERLGAAFVRLGVASDRELDVMRLLAREALSSSSRRHRIVERFLRGHLPLLFAALRQGVRAGELDAELPAPFLALAVMGLGGLPQLLRRSIGEVPGLGRLPNPEALAALSLEVLQRAIGSRPHGTARSRGAWKDDTWNASAQSLYGPPMSTDGHQRIVLLRVKKEADLEERALDALADDRASNAASAPRIVTLDYRFGRGLPHAVDFDQLDEVVTLPWSRVKTDAEEAEVRMLGIKAVPSASTILGDLRKKPRTLSKRIAEACQEEDLAEIALETLASDPTELDVDDADVTPARLAQFFMQLRRLLRLAASRKECVGAAIQVELS